LRRWVGRVLCTYLSWRTVPYRTVPFRSTKDHDVTVTCIR
jgi:hypothetical protein